MTESTVVFSISTDSKGSIKVNLDSANKKIGEKSVKKEDFEERPPSPTLSLSTLTSEPLLHHGSRRRVVSTSTQSVVSSSLFEDDIEESSDRTSTPLPHFDDLSDASFISCVSNLSIETCSSQETVKNDPEPMEPMPSIKIAKSSGLVFGEAKKKELSYEQVNKNRYGGSGDQGNWRSAPRRDKEQRSPPKPSPSFSSTSNSSRRQTPTNSTSASRIPSLVGRSIFPPAPKPVSTLVTPTKPLAPPPRPLPSSRVSASVGSYASAASNPRSPATSTIIGKNSGRSSTLTPAPTAPISRFSGICGSPVDNTIKLTIVTGSDGKIRLQFSNSNSSESWIIDAAQEKVDVQKIVDSNNN